MKHPILSLIFLLSVTSLHAQKPDTLSSRIFSIDLTGGATYQQALGAGTPTFKAPGYLSLRRPTEPELANLWGLRNNEDITDSPPGHGPMYIRPHMWYTPVPSLELYASLEVDHRGASWGPYNTDNIAFIPRFHAAYSDWRKFNNGDSIRVFGKMGFYEDYRNYEGLTMYNLDVQGFSAGVQYGKVALATHRTGDLIRSYGLGIDGMTDYQLGLLGLKVSGAWQADVKVGVQKIAGYPEIGGDQHLLQTSVAFYRSQRRVYAEAGYRDSDFTPGNRSALLVGISDRLAVGKLKLVWRGEYRFYGGGFNYQFRNESATHFRDVNRAAGSNLLGDSVYPMSFFGRPFSQWAVFTEYDKAWVQGITWFGTVSYQVGRNVDVFSDLDLNHILAEGEDSFLYPFYNAGLKLDVVRNTFLSLSMSNRTMNLDKHYTTYYLSNSPLFQFELKRSL
jgi:hypothetical protein